MIYFMKNLNIRFKICIKSFYLPVLICTSCLTCHINIRINYFISNNNIKAPYLLWNEANLDQSKITSSGNTLDIANRDKAMTKTGAIDSTTTINGTVVEHPIVIITPTEDTPKTEPEKNPTTGANDVVAAAVALMAVSALGAAVLTRKK